MAFIEPWPCRHDRQRFQIDTAMLTDKSDPTAELPCVVIKPAGDAGLRYLAAQHQRDGSVIVWFKPEPNWS